MIVSTGLRVHRIALEGDRLLIYLRRAPGRVRDGIGGRSPTLSKVLKEPGGKRDIAAVFLVSLECRVIRVNLNSGHFRSPPYDWRKA